MNMYTATATLIIIYTNIHTLMRMVTFTRTHIPMQTALTSMITATSILQSTPGKS